MSSVDEDRFQELRVIGTSSVLNRIIFEYLDTKTGARVAFRNLMLKPIEEDKEEENGLPPSIVREICLYSTMKHDNIARMVNVEYGRSYAALAFQYLGDDLEEIRDYLVADDPNFIKVKKLLYQLLRGVAYYHSVGAVHGNLNCKNVLIEFNTTKKEYHLRITNLQLVIDNGLYKAPELVMDTKELSSAADLFSVGCIFGEMLRKKPLFQSLDSIFRLMGTPTEENWPMGYKMYKGHSTYPPEDLSKQFPGLEPTGVDLLSKLLCLDPSKRITAVDALKHGYFGTLVASISNDSNEASSTILGVAEETSSLLRQLHT